MKAYYPAMIFTVLFITACASSNTPIDNQLNSKELQLFLPQDVVHIFGGDLDDGPLPSEPLMSDCHDVDNAVVIDSITREPALFPDNRKFTAFVTLERIDDFTFIPRFRWLPSGGMGAWNLSSYVNTVPDIDYFCYRSPKCSAIRLANGDVQLAVCYEVQYEDEEDDWDIGVTLLTWPEGTFPDGEPVRGNESVWQLGSVDTTERWPDLAYDSDTCRLYLVYSEYSLNDDPHASVHLKYRRYDGNWSNEYDIDDHDNISYSCLIPRIDVGLIDGVFGQPDQKTVGIVYTAQYCADWGNPHLGYHVHLFFWNADQVGNGDKLANGVNIIKRCLRNPVGDDPNNPGDYYDPVASTWWNNAGMPYIDIGPDTNEDNYGSVVFVQIVGTDNYGPIAEVWEVNSLNPIFASISGVDPQWGMDDGLYPSIGLHYESGFTTPHWASLTYLRQEANGSSCQPWVCNIHLDNHSILPNTSDSVPGGISVGLFNSDQLPFMNPGVASSISVTNVRNNYWAAWCDRLEIAYQPSEVWAAYGFVGI